MKVILYSVMPVIPPDYGGAVRIFNLARALSNKGIEVIMVSPRPSHMIQLDKKIDYVFFDSSIPRILQKIPGICKLKNFLCLFIFFGQFRLLKKIVRSNLNCTTALVLQSEYLYSVAPLFLLKKIFHLPLVITEHNVESKLSLEISHNPIYSHILRTIEQRYLKHCDYVVCVSEADKAILNKEYSISSKKIFVSPNATTLPVLYDPINVDMDKIKNESGVRPDKKIVLFMGTLEYTPNINATHIIESYICPYVCSKLSNVVFMIVGKGTQPKSSGSIVFTGVVDDVDPYLRMADIAIAPLTEGGGTRLKILEYMAYGKPVISTSKGAEGLDVINGRHIIISNEWEQFSENIVELLCDENKRSEIGRNARLLVEERYTWEKSCEVYIHIYHELSLSKNRE